MQIDLVTIFPDFFEVLNLSLLGKAKERKLLKLESHDLRKWTSDRHRSVDDTPYGGGPGMVMRADIWGNALDQILSLPLPNEAPRRVLVIPTPSGSLYTQRDAEDLARADQIVIACGRYEGIDSRVSEHLSDSAAIEVREFSVGDYVLNGGETAALAIVETIARLLPEVIGNPDSLREESHSAGMLEYPVYTKPAEWRDLPVPQVLIGGNHALIERWRRDQSLQRTVQRRPDLARKLDPKELSPSDHEILAGAGLVLLPEPAEVEIRVAEGFEYRKAIDLAQVTWADSGNSVQVLDHEMVEQWNLAEPSVNTASEVISDTFEDRSRLALAAWNGSEIVAVTLIRLILSENRGKMAIISACNVLPRWRNAGIQGAVLAETIKLASEIWPELEQIWIGLKSPDKDFIDLLKRRGLRKHTRKRLEPILEGSVELELSSPTLMVRNFTKESQ